MDFGEWINFGDSWNYKTWVLTYMIFQLIPRIDSQIVGIKARMGQHVWFGDHWTCEKKWWAIRHPRRSNGFRMRDVGLDQSTPCVKLGHFSSFGSEILIALVLVLLFDSFRSSPSLMRFRDRYWSTKFQETKQKTTWNCKQEKIKHPKSLYFKFATNPS